MHSCINASLLNYTLETLIKIQRTIVYKLETMSLALSKHVYTLAVM